MSSVSGIHHVTAIAGDPQRNLDFYAGILGLRFVKRTVNFDDPHTYHFYFGDEAGTPGSIMTFFPWPDGKRGAVGSGQVAVTSFAVMPGAIAFWVERLIRYNIRYEGPTRRHSDTGVEYVLAFKDHDGLMLEIVGHEGAASRPTWEGAQGIPAEHAIHGFHGVTLWVVNRDDTERVLTSALAFRELHDEGTTRRYSIGDGGPGTFVGVREIGEFGHGTTGVGTIHHVAFSVPDDASQHAAREAAISAGMHPTPVIDRKYFRSVYFREPGGVLFELATAQPGFAIDEPADRLGETLQLPEQYEARRETIEKLLPVIHPPGG
jgi:catechol 2,3-dioxygenase-like lactoylglutathione lyase family enzyme